MPNPASRPASEHWTPNLAPILTGATILRSYHGRPNFIGNEKAPGYMPGEHLGMRIENFGDMDLDGVNDYAVTALCGAYAFYFGPGIVRICSGRTGEMLRQFFGSEVLETMGHGRYDGFGNAIGNAGDVNRDGRTDVIILAPRWKRSTGYANVYSGLDGTLLHHLPGESEFSHWLYGRVGTVGDVDGDRHDDVFVECDDGGGTLVYSGKTGAKLFGSKEPPSPLARQVLDGIHRYVGDVNKDGIDDWIDSDEDAIVSVKSGKNDKVLLRFDAKPPEPWEFDRAGAAGDINGDGVPDLWVCSHVPVGTPAQADSSIPASAKRGDVKVESRQASIPFPPQRQLKVISGVDGRELHRVDSPWEEFARYGVAGVGDLDGDGRGELVVGFHESPYLGACGGSVFVLSFPASRR